MQGLCRFSPTRRWPPARKWISLSASGGGTVCTSAPPEIKNRDKKLRTELKKTETKIKDSFFFFFFFGIFCCVPHQAC